MAPLQVARLGWLPRQKLPLHDGWQRNELEKYATSHKMSYENRTKSGMTKIVLPGSWGCHHCKNDRGPPQNDTLGKVGQGIATATRIEADSISECPFTLYQILSVTQSNSRASPTQTWIAFGILVDTILSTTVHFIFFCLLFCTRKGHNFPV